MRCPCRDLLMVSSAVDVPRGSSTSSTPTKTLVRHVYAVPCRDRVVLSDLSHGVSCPVSGRHEIRVTAPLCHGLAGPSAWSARVGPPSAGRCRPRLGDRCVPSRRRGPPAPGPVIVLTAVVTWWPWVGPPVVNRVPSPAGQPGCRCAGPRPGLSLRRTEALDVVARLAPGRGPGCRCARPRGRGTTKICLHSLASEKYISRKDSAVTTLVTSTNAWYEPNV
jgi:hypothetical protein